LQQEKYVHDEKESTKRKTLFWTMTQIQNLIAIFSCVFPTFWLPNKQQCYSKSKGSLTWRICFNLLVLKGFCSYKDTEPDLYLFLLSPSSATVQHAYK